MELLDKIMNMDWKEMSNSEIEVKLKELEFKYEKIKTNIIKLYDELNKLNNDYINGKFIIDKRLNPTKLK